MGRMVARTHLAQLLLSRFLIIPSSSVPSERKTKLESFFTPL